MDVSIAVSLIRGQMGAVVERAVNGAVETVLAEMLKVVGGKFEELKAQLAHMKHDMATLQREKALKEKENDNIRAKLRYTELKLKYYRQGVEEELQHRASSTSLVQCHQSKCSPAQPPGASVSSTGASPSCSSQTSTADNPLTSNQESPQPKNQHCINSCNQSDVQVVGCKPTDCTLTVSDPMSTESLENSDQDVPLSTGAGGQGGKWDATVHLYSDGTDTIVSPPPPPTRNADQQSVTCPPSPRGSPQADSSTIAISTTQVKIEEEDQQVICIKGEPEEEQQMMSCLLLDTQINGGHLVQSEVTMSATEWSGLQASQRKCSSGSSSAGPSSSYATPQTGFPTIAPLPPGSARQIVRDPWTKDFSLYEEYKIRRNELRRRSLNRRRELEKTLPQPLLADLVRERREKTRLRVARWRAKRKLQACLNQVQTQGGAVSLSQDVFPISGPHQHKTPCAPTSGPLNNVVISGITTFPFVTPPSSSLFLRGPNMPAQVNQHVLMSSPHSASYPQVSLTQQSTSLTDGSVDQ
ncbi:uncharacterized protein si:ch211-67e16.4 isoform X2 [Syngnathoides biaculeatus]|uniref:uncharacterized protein si:ch211-67e16.4 isoform X2 n=1 Tax=Syngnathoides biaculeatus TaxID=300417 RepID=UPI002ADE3935|nr:uncharacterized protein si:ch211-67e16.4 isoform X2 [Syngnathoides biaculeatus]